MAIVLSWVVGVPVGILSALRQNTLLDYVARFFTVLFLAIPSFWLGAMIVLGLLLWRDYAPPWGSSISGIIPSRICKSSGDPHSSWGWPSRRTLPV